MLIAANPANLFAQISRGNFFGSNLGGRQPTPEEAAAAQQAEQARQVKAKSDALGGHVFRRVDGKIYNLWQTGKSVGGWVQSVEDDTVIIRQARDYGELFAIKNFNGEAVYDKYIFTVAMPSGTYKSGGTPMKLFDCGMILAPNEEQQQEQAAREQMAAVEKAKADIIAAKREDQRQKSFLAQSNTVLHLQTLATNGEAWAQCSLGKHYLNGQGCETNRALAVKWLTTAAGNGSMEASNALETLKP